MNIDIINIIDNINITINVNIYVINIVDNIDAIYMSLYTLKEIFISILIVASFKSIVIQSSDRLHFPVS